MWQIVPNLILSGVVWCGVDTIYNAGLSQSPGLKSISPMNMSQHGYWCLLVSTAREMSTCSNIGPLRFKYVENVKILKSTKLLVGTFLIMVPLYVKSGMNSTRNQKSLYFQTLVLESTFTSIWYQKWKMYLLNGWYS